MTGKVKGQVTALALVKTHEHLILRW